MPRMSRRTRRLYKVRKGDIFERCRTKGEFTFGGEERVLHQAWTGRGSRRKNEKQRRETSRAFANFFRFSERFPVFTRILLRDCLFSNRFSLPRPQSSLVNFVADWWQGEWTLSPLGRSFSPMGPTSSCLALWGSSAAPTANRPQAANAQATFLAWAFSWWRSLGCWQGGHSDVQVLGARVETISQIANEMTDLRVSIFSSYTLFRTLLTQRRATYRKRKNSTFD